MATVHGVLARAFAVLLDPLAALSPLAGLTVVSAASGVVLLLAFRVTSNPTAIRRARQKAQAHLLAVRLYRDDLIVVMRSQGALLAALAVYLGHMALPFLAVLLPFAMLFAHLDARYGSRALHPGERAILTATVAPQTLDHWRLEGATGVAVDSQPVRIPGRGEISWRLRAVAPGRYEVALANGERRVAKAVWVAAGDSGAAPLRARAGLAAFLLAPTEPSLDSDAGVESVAISYPPLRLSILGWRVHWIVVFLIVSAVVAFLFRRRIGVEF